MGLDMYLQAERFMWYNEEELAGKVSALFPELPAGILAKTVQFDVGYWRKANAIHRWFVDNVQGGVDQCQTSAVSREHIRTLLGLCEQAMADQSRAGQLLPTKTGFFFGDTSYDLGYFEDVQSTIDICQRALMLPEAFKLSYRASW